MRARALTRLMRSRSPHYRPGVPLQQVDGGRPAEVTGPSMPTHVTAWLVSTASRREVPAVLVGQLELSHHAPRVVDYRHGQGAFVGCRYRQTFALLFLAGHFRSRASAGISRGTSSFPQSLYRASAGQTNRRREAPTTQSLGRAGQQKVSLPGDGADPDGVEVSASSPEMQEVYRICDLR